MYIYYLYIILIGLEPGNHGILAIVGVTVGIWLEVETVGWNHVYVGKVFATMDIRVVTHPGTGSSGRCLLSITLRD